jgi:hypothetical protein
MNKQMFPRENPVGCRQHRPITPDWSGRVRRTRTVSYSLHGPYIVVPGKWMSGMAGDWFGGVSQKLMPEMLE